MGRISDLIPPIYYNGQNNISTFVDALDYNVKELEKCVKGITDLINVDKCPDGELPYLAAITNCPLMGNSPALWRRQIKNWPFILKIKGSPLSLEIFLNSIDVDEYKLYTFFRDSDGELVEEKPDGAPFVDSSGVWHNIRTHLFDLDLIYNNHHYLTWPLWHEDLLRSINIWMSRAKPFHSELRNLRVILQRNSQIELAVGTGTFQATHHDINIVQKTSSSDGLNISIGTGTFQTTRHDIAIVQGTYSATGLDMYVGAGIVQGGRHDIDMVQGTSGSSGLEVVIGTGTFHTWTHDVKHVQATEAETCSAIAVGANLVQSAAHEVDIQQHTSGNANLDLSIGTGTFQNVKHDLKIQQTTHSTAEDNILIGAGITAGSFHDVDIQQPTSSQAQVVSHVGIGVLHDIKHEIKLAPTVKTETELNILTAAGILQSAVHTISAGISTIAKSAIYTGTILTQEVSHTVGLKQSNYANYSDVVITTGTAQGKRQSIALRQAKSACATLALPVSLKLCHGVIHNIKAGMSALSKAECSVTSKLSAGCAIACGIHMQIKMAA